MNEPTPPEPKPGPANYSAWHDLNRMLDDLISTNGNLQEETTRLQARVAELEQRKPADHVRELADEFSKMSSELINEHVDEVERFEVRVAELEKQVAHYEACKAAEVSHVVIPDDEIGENSRGENCI